MKKSLVLSAIALVVVVLFVQCNNTKTETAVTAKENFNRFESQVKWGQHLVTVSACHDCHTPKKMTPTGPDLDSSLLLAGHIAGSPEPVADKKEVQGNGL